MYQLLAATLDTCYARIRAIQQDARADGVAKRPRWPVIVLRTPKGWTGPEVVDGAPIEGAFRAHQAPLANVRADPSHLARLETWLRGYHPEELFDADGRLAPELAALAPVGDRRMGANPHANGGRLLVDLDLPAFRAYAVAVPSPATERRESTRELGKLLRDTFTRNQEQQNFRLFCPDETNSNRLDNVFEVENRCFVGTTILIDDHMTPDGR